MNVVIENSNIARVTFDAPVLANSAAYSPSNYAVRNRLTGEQVGFASVALVLDNNGHATHAVLTALYYFLRRGVYTFNALGLTYAAGSGVSSDDVLFRDEMPFSTPYQMFDTTDLVKTGTDQVHRVSVAGRGTGGAHTFVITCIHSTLPVPPYSEIVGYNLAIDGDYVTVDMGTHTTADPRGAGLLFYFFTVPGPDEDGDQYTFSTVGAEWISVPASQYYFAAQRAIFKWVNTKSSSTLGQLLYSITLMLHAFGGDEATTEGLLDAKLGLVLNSAVGTDLDVIGQNYGIPRPRNIADDLYRKVIVAMAFKPKLVLPIIYELLEAILGPQADVHWQVYEVRPATITIFLGDYVLPSGPDLSSYLLTPATEVSPSLPGDYLTSGVAVNNLCPVYLGTFKPRVPVLEDLFDICKAAGVTVEFKRP